MAEASDPQESQKLTDSPLVFISHDSRDANLAEAFSKLLKSVSAGMLKSFRSSDKKGNEGIEFGDEWYKTLMAKLDKASDVVCLLTESSLNRPWILYEAGVAKGKLGTPVHGIALGVPLGSVSAGPFYQFQNSDDSDESLSKLVLQLCRRVGGLEPDPSVVETQVLAFKASVKVLQGENKAPKAEAVEEGSVAKVLEEMKLIVRELPVRLESRLVEATEYSRSRKLGSRRFHPRMLDELIHRYSKRANDPIGLLIIASFLREDFPWLYEIGLEAYRSTKRSIPTTQSPTMLMNFRDAVEMTMHDPWVHEMGLTSKEMGHLLMTVMMMIDRYIEQVLARQKRKISEDEPEFSNNSESQL